MFEAIISIVSVVILVICCIVLKHFGNSIIYKVTGRKPMSSDSLQIENELPKFDLGNII